MLIKFLKWFNCFNSASPACSSFLPHTKRHILTCDHYQLSQSQGLYLCVPMFFLNQRILRYMTILRCKKRMLSWLVLPWPAAIKALAFFEIAKNYAICQRFLKTGWLGKIKCKVYILLTSRNYFPLISKIEPGWWIKYSTHPSINQSRNSSHHSHNSLCNF